MSKRLLDLLGPGAITNNVMLESRGPWGKQMHGTVAAKRPPLPTIYVVGQTRLGSAPTCTSQATIGKVAVSQLPIDSSGCRSGTHDCTRLGAKVSQPSQMNFAARCYQNHAWATIVTGALVPEKPFVPPNLMSFDRLVTAGWSL